MSIKAKMLTLLAAIASIGGLAFAAQSQAVYVDTTPDCDKFAIVHCGTKDLTEIRRQYDSRNTNGSNGSTKRQNDIPAIFSAMGISRSDLEGRNSQFTFGVVYRDGRVTANGKTVAKNAKIAGRHMGGASIKGSSSAGIVPTSKMASAQRVVVKLDYNGKFLWAVATPCGNPISATNIVKDKPVAQCDSLANPVITNRTKVSLASKATAKNGAKIQSHVFTLHDKSGKQINQRVVKTSASTANTSMELPTPGNYTAKVVIMTNIGKKTAPACEKKFTIKPEPAKPVYTCDALDVEQISRAKFRYTSEITAKNGASVESRTFDYGDGETETKGATGAVEYTYAKPGTYTTKLTANIAVNGKTVQATSAACEATVKVKEADKPGVAIVKTVNGVEHEVVDVNEVFDYEIKVTNTGNVDLKDALVTDPAPEGVTFKSAEKGEINDNEWSYTISTLKVGESADFVIKAVVAEYLPGIITNNACVETPTVPGEKPCDDATVEVPEPEEEPVERCDTTTNEIVTISPEEAKKDKYTTDYSQCEEKPTTPPELPETGISGTLSAVLGLGSLTAATYYYAASRRL